MGIATCICKGHERGGGGGGGGGVSVASLTLRQLVWVCDKVILYCV